MTGAKEDGGTCISEGERHKDGRQQSKGRGDEGKGPITSPVSPKRGEYRQHRHPET